MGAEQQNSRGNLAEHPEHKLHSSLPPTTGHAGSLVECSLADRDYFQWYSMIAKRVVKFSSSQVSVEYGARDRQ